MKKPELNRKRCSPLPDIYTPIDKTSTIERFVQFGLNLLSSLLLLEGYKPRIETTGSYCRSLCTFCKLNQHVKKQP